MDSESVLSVIYASSDSAAIAHDVLLDQRNITAAAIAMNS